MAFKAVALDTGSTLVYSCLDGETRAAIPLTGCVVTLAWVDPNGSMQRRAMTAATPANGKASYTFQAGELSPPEMAFDVHIVDSMGNELTCLDPLVLPVRGRLAAHASPALAGVAATGRAGML